MLLDDTDYPKDWPIIHLDRVAKRGSGHTPSKSHPEYWNGNIKWVSLADSYRLDGGYISDTDKKISQEGIKNSSAVIHPPETVILSRDAGVGKSAVTKEAMAVSQHFIAWNCNQAGKVAPWFLYYTLQFHQKELERQAVGSTIKTIGLPFFKNLEIALPPLPEQEKIAAILSTWDRAIEGTEKLLANSQKQKKALMQQLLTGKKRLPGFTGEWKTKTFSDLFTLKIGGTPARSNMAYWDTDKTTPNRWVAISDLKTSKIHSTSEHISDLGAKNSNCSLIPKGTIILSFKLTIGKKAILLEDCYTNEAICALIIKNTKSTDAIYIYQALDNVNYEDEIDQAVKGKTLNKEKLARLRMPFPALPEQKAIAAVLTTADEEITALESDLTRLRQEKKALMQQLLTGKRRVTID